MTAVHSTMDSKRCCRVVLSKWWGELTIAVVAVVSFLLVWPVGEYAILDDWAFAKSLQHLHERGELVVLDWNPMSLIGHLVWGLLFTKCFGFSFFVTRLSAFVAGVILVLIVYRICRRMGVCAGLSCTAALGLWLNPLFLPHCFMYMTDVTSLMWQWLSLVCLLKAGVGKARHEYALLIVGSLLWALAFLTRQHGIVVPLAWMTYLILFDRRRLWSVTLLGACLPGAWLAANGLMWHRMTQGNNLAFSTSSDLVWEFLSDPPWSELPFLIFSYAVYIGLFALPIIVSVSWRDVRRLSGSPLLIAGVTTWFSVFLFVQYSMRGQLFPYIRNVVTNWGLFHPHEFVVGDRPQLWDRGWGTAVGLTGVLSFVLWQTTVVARRLMAGCYHRNADDAVSDDEPLRHRRILVLLLIFQMGYVFATSPILYDRHLLLLAPTVIILGAASVRRARLVAPAVVLIGYGAYAVCGTHDVHLISRAVFCEGTRLLESGVAADRIDAGYAFDGWHMYETSQQIQPAVPMRLPPWWPTDRAVRTTELRQPWWIYNLVTQVHPEYIVSISADVPSQMFDSAGHLQVVGKSEAGFTWAPWRRLVIVVFQRSSQ